MKIGLSLSVFIRGRRVEGLIAGLVSYGWDYSINLGTDGDYFVDKAVSSSGDGLTPATAFKTITEAVAKVISDGAPRTIKVIGAGVKYRESISLKNFSGSILAQSYISGYGTDKPIITGGDSLTGWVSCTVSDLPDVGNNYASMYKAILSKSLIAAGDGFGINLFEAGAAMPLATDRADKTDMFWTTDALTFHTANTFTFDGNGKIAGITDTSVLGRYTAAQLVGRASVYVYRSPNAVSRVNITAANGVDNITVDGLLTPEDSGNPKYRNYSIANVLPAMAQGESGFIDNGDGTITVYCWPTNPANLEAGIEYSARGYAFDIADTTNYVTIEGFEMVQMSSATNPENGCGITTAFNTINKKTDIVIRHCYSGDHFNGDGNGYGGYYLANIDNLIFEYCTAENISGGFGFFVAGGSVDNTDYATLQLSDQALDGRVRNLHVIKAEKSPARFYTQKNMAFSYSLLESSGKAAHANQFNFYEQSDNILVYGIKGKDLTGYSTWQETSNVIMMFNDIAVGEALTAPGRGIDDQNSTTANPAKTFGLNSNIYLINNTVHPHSTSLDSINGISLGSTSAEHDNTYFHMYNNLAHGRSPMGPYGTMSNSEGNIFTADDGIGGAGDLSVDYGIVFEDATDSNFTYYDDAPNIVNNGVDLAALVSGTLQPLFPDFDFSKDADGEDVSWSDAPIGSYVNSSTVPAPVYTTQWQEFDGQSVIERNAQLNGAIGVTTKLTAVFTYRPTAADLAADTGLINFIGSTNYPMIIQTSSTGRLKVKAEDDTNANRFNITSSTSMVADTEYAVLLSFDTGAAGAGAFITVVEVETGVVAFSFSSAVNNFNIDTGSAIGFLIGARGTTLSGTSTGRFERVQMWEGVGIDFTQQANRNLVIGESGGLIHPATIVADLGLPSVYMRGTDIADPPINRGYGGNFIKDGSGEITPIIEPI